MTQIVRRTITIWLWFSVFLAGTAGETFADDCSALFRSPRSFDTEREPHGVAAADLNDDGFTDLAVSNHGNRWVSILLAALDLAIDDFNHDNIFDIAVACESTGTVSVLLGNGAAGVGDGTYPPRADYAAGSGASSVAADDFDGDGDIDLAVACSSIDSVAFLKGNGDGTFQGPVRYAVGLPGAAPKDIFCFFANEDTLPDLAVTCSGEDSVAVLDGLGGGAFAAPRKYVSGAEPWGITGGDFNGDDIIDLATANRSGSTASIFIGNGAGGVGDGTFQAALTNGAGNGAWYIQTGDVNNDGVDDLAVSSAYTDLLILLAGVGDGTFSPAVSLDVGDDPAGVAIAQLNGDPYADIAVASRYSDDVSIVAANPTGDGTMIVKKDYDVGKSPWALLTGDVNEDGILDILASDAQEMAVTILLGAGSDSTWSGTFLSPESYSAGDWINSMALADLNEDDILDIVTSNRGTNDMTVLIGNGIGGVGDGTFQPPVSYPAGQWNRKIVVLDFNGDDILDAFYGGFLSNTITMFMGNGVAGVGDGTFTLLDSLATGNRPQCIAVEDYDGDGILDLAVVLADDNNMSIRIGGGTGGVWDSTFAAAVTYPIGNYPTYMEAGDLDGGGVLDIVTADMMSDQISVLLGNGTGGVGDGTFAPAVSYPAGNQPRRLVLADFNLDGILDAAVTNRESDDFSVFLGVGDGTFEDEERFDAGKYPWGIVASDLNGDGAPDIVISNRDGWDVSVVMNMSCFYVGVEETLAPRPLFSPVTAPNPFNPSTTILFTVKEPGEVTVDIYDVRGRLVRTMASHAFTPGLHKTVWNGIDRSGIPSSSGLYLYRIRSGRQTATGKMILAR